MATKQHRCQGNFQKTRQAAKRNSQARSVARSAEETRTHPNTNTTETMQRSCYHKPICSKQNAQSARSKERLCCEGSQQQTGSFAAEEAEFSEQTNALTWQQNSAHDYCTFSHCFASQRSCFGVNFRKLLELLNRRGIFFTIPWAFHMDVCPTILSSRKIPPGAPLQTRIPVNGYVTRALRPVPRPVHVATQHTTLAPSVNTGLTTSGPSDPRVQVSMTMTFLLPAKNPQGMVP